MGGLLKEALKVLCGSNQWSYAVFWKVGCQNPKLLIWEEFHYETSLCSGSSGSRSVSTKLLFQKSEECCISSENGYTHLGIQSDNRIESLINKMMLNSQITIVGEGIIGRAAFTGTHRWILSKNYSGDADPPEVLNEVHQQFSAGMQTIAVIPISPHGVVQLASSLAIMEDKGFVNDVKSVILRLGGVPGALLSDSHAAEDPTEGTGRPITLGTPVSIVPCHKEINPFLMADSRYQQGNLSQNSRLVDQLSHSFSKEINHRQHHANPNLTQTFDGGLHGPDELLNHQGSSSSKVKVNFGQSGAGHGSMKLMEHCIMSGSGIELDGNTTSSQVSMNLSEMRTNGAVILDCPRGSCTTSYLQGSPSESGTKRNLRANSVLCSSKNPEKSAFDNTFGISDFSGIDIQSTEFSKIEENSLSSVLDHLISDDMLLGPSDHTHFSIDDKHFGNEFAPTESKTDNDLFQALYTTLAHRAGFIPLREQTPGFLREYQIQSEIMSPTLSNLKLQEKFAQTPVGSDLYDILGVEYKSNLINGNQNDLHAYGPGENAHDSGSGSLFKNLHDEGIGSDIGSMSDGKSHADIFTSITSDNLLDAVVCRGISAANQSTDDNVSCRTTLTKLSCSSVPNDSITHGRASISDQQQRNLFGLSKPLDKSGTLDSSSSKSGCSKNDLVHCSKSNSGCGSQISSWVDQANNVKRDTSVSTAYSKRPEQANKSGRKRLKSGENPKPRPKDRQMIQDRVKELREIVPNGAKCSIDALLERTIKHMLFLQSVTKHADKLKQTGESKITNKEGGLFLKDNFEAGATWAFEFGSQSMVCPIIVEDLNAPRQMLVEMLCEEGGFFLEIADLIRGLGLTTLKGVMETRDSKIWARFVVEANRDVTRMEVFMSLVHLLEQTMKGKSLANAINNNQMMVHNSATQAAFISATGRPGSLQ